MTVMNVITRLVSGIETEDTVSAKSKTRSKDKLKWATMMEKMFQGSEVNRGMKI